MKKLLILLLSVLSLTAVAQDVKKVAILDVIDKNNDVDDGLKFMLRENLSAAISNTSGYEAFNRTDISLIVEELNFQRTGLVSDQQIRKIGEITGTQYILVAEVGQIKNDKNNIILSAKLIDVETSKIVNNTVPEYVSTDPTIFQLSCIDLASKLLNFDIKPNDRLESNTQSTKANTNKIKEDYSTENVINKKFSKHPFSIGQDKGVYFSQGNLQYNTSNNTARFAAHQYDYVNYMATTREWDDLLFWAPKNSSDKKEQDSPAFDWGQYPIVNGGNVPNLWRTLCPNEWEYLFLYRKNALDLFAPANINGVNGLIILPDDWNLQGSKRFKTASQMGFRELKNSSNGSYYIIDEGSSASRNYKRNAFTIGEWEQLEKSGAIFLPAAYFIVSNKIIQNENEYSVGHYWSHHARDYDIGDCLMGFKTFCVHPILGRRIGYRAYVRLVQDIVDKK